MKSKTLIEKQANRKLNLELVETIILAKKNKAWLKVAGLLSQPRRKKIQINLNVINKELKQGEIGVVPGKVLSLGEIEKGKKIRVAGLNFSEKAKEKLLKAGCEVVLLKDEIKKNKEAKAVKILK